MSVYIVTDGKYFKIGYTDGAVETRIDALQTGNPNRLILVHQMDGSRALEKELHGVYAAKRLNGEWFDLTNKDLKTIKDTFCAACGSRRTPVKQEPSISVVTPTLALPRTTPAALAVEGKQSGAGVVIPSEIPLWQVPPWLCQPVGVETVFGSITDPSWVKVQAICVGHDLSVVLGEDVVRLVFRPLFRGATPWKGFIYWQLGFENNCANKTLATLKQLGWQAPDFDSLLANDLKASGLGDHSHDLAIGLDKNKNQEVKGILEGLTF